MSIESTGLFKSVKIAERQSEDITRSIAKGFAFPVPKEVCDLPDTSRVRIHEGGEETIAKKELMKAVLIAIHRAWETAIKPIIGDVRKQMLERASIKSGTDFFTVADTSSEHLIREYLFDQFGRENLRIFGEEANTYLGNTESRIGIRIDPIDGTESMKFGKTQDWSIMVGVYEGDLEHERQVMGAFYFPERNAIVYQIDELPGVYISIPDSGQVYKFESLTPQEDLGNLIIAYWKHTDPKRKGAIDEVENALREHGARLRSTNSASADVLEAIQTQGQRAIVMDGDITTVDYIAYTFLQKLGYELYDWNGNRLDADQTDLTDKKIVLVPPGGAGRKIVDIVVQAVAV